MLEYVTAYALLGENDKEPSKANLTKVLEAVGVKVSEKSLEQLLSSIGGRSYSEVAASGYELKKTQILSSSSNNAAEQNNAKVEEEEAQESDSDSAAIDFF